MAIQHTLNAGTERLLDSLIFPIIQAEAPEEVDIYEAISEEFYESTRFEVSGTPGRGQMLSFSFPELYEFLTNALLSTMLVVVVPFLFELYSKAAGKTAEKLVDAGASKLNEILDPDEMTELERELRKQLRKSGRSRKEAKRLSQSIIKALSNASQSETFAYLKDEFP